MRAFDTAWQKRQNEAGWGGIAWPTDYGGRGLSLIEQLIWHEEYAHAGAPPPGCMFVALNHGGPTLILRGNEAQKAFHIPRIIAGDAVWCQGFSEPGAGSGPCRHPYPRRGGRRSSRRHRPKSLDQLWRRLPITRSCWSAPIPICRATRAWPG